MQCMQHFEDPLYGGMLGPFMRGDTPYVSQYRRVIGTAGIIGSVLRKIIVPGIGNKIPHFQKGKSPKSERDML